LLAEGFARASADLSSRLPTFIVQFRTVLAVVFANNGKSSPNKSATLPNGARQPFWL
jgi:hypothetical protein